MENKIRVIFSQKSESALSEIIKEYNLEEYSAMVKIDYASKALAIKKFSETEAVNYLEKELKMSLQKSKQLLTAIINRIVPFLEKYPEEKFEDPVFREEISKKIFEEAVKKHTPAAPTQKIKNDDNRNISPIINPLADIANPLGKNTPIKEKVIKKTTITEKIDKPFSELKQSKKSDNYREPID